MLSTWLTLFSKTQTCPRYYAPRDNNWKYYQRYIWYFRIHSHHSHPRSRLDDMEACQATIAAFKPAPPIPGRWIPEAGALLSKSNNAVIVIELDDGSLLLRAVRNNNGHSHEAWPRDWSLILWLIVGKRLKRVLRTTCYGGNRYDEW